MAAVTFLRYVRRLNSDIKRAAAKICFNYLAAIHGAGFALQAEFNDIRAYVRYDVRGSLEYVHATTDPLLTDEAGKRKRVYGHLVTVNRSMGPGGVVGQLSLFNLLTYRVILTTRFFGDRANLDSGHISSVKGWKVYRLGHVPRGEYMKRKGRGK